MGVRGIRLVVFGLAFAPACILDVDAPGEPCGGEACPADAAVDGAASLPDGPPPDGAPVDGASIQVLERRIATGEDDAEQRPDDTMYIHSTDLELVEEAAGDPPQIVGMRFTDVDVPPGATVEAAYVQFQVDEVTSVETAVEVRGEASDSAAAFSTTAGDLSGRATTAASVAWSPPPWGVEGEAGEAQRTPDLSPIVQEILDRPGWQAGGALALIVTGSGRRVGEAFEGDAAAAALLRVEFRSP